MAGLSATQRTLRHLRQQGLVCAIVEKWNPHARMRQDLFQIIDIIALDPLEGVLGIQSTTGSNFSEHRKKLLEEQYQKTLDWLSTPGTKLYLYGWRKTKVKRGSAAVVWTPRIEEITIDQLVQHKEVSDED